MVCASSWMCAIAVLLTALAQSQAQSSIPANETPNKTPIPNTRKLITIVSYQPN